MPAPTASWLGLGDAHQAWRRGDPLFLEEREFEMIVTMGEGADLPRVRTLLEVAGLTPRPVRLLARFGHPGVIPVLLHGLKDDELKEDAALALEIILGPKLDSDARIVPEAWAGVIAQTEIPRDGRMWFGEPHQPTTFAREVERGRLSLMDLEEILEELRIRSGCAGSTSLHGWHAANTARFDQLRVELGRANEMCKHGQLELRAQLGNVVRHGMSHSATRASAVSTTPPVTVRAATHNRTYYRDKGEAASGSSSYVYST